MDKKRSILLARLLALLVSVMSIYIWAPWRAGLMYISPLPDTLDEQLSQVTDGEFDGIIVYVDQGGKPPIAVAKGWHNRQEKIPARPDALFKIASIAKLYNAAAITKLVVHGSLSLGDTLAQHLPNLASRFEYSDQITIEQMVKHVSGLPNYTDQEGFSWSEKEVGKNENLQLVLDLPADFAPGTDYGYSNTNYLLLGMIMDKVLGFERKRFIQQAILDPLGLNDTYFSVNDVELSKLMSGYYVGYKDDFKSLDQGYVATAEDVGVFLRALNDGSLFTEEEAKLYSTLYEYEHTGWVLGYYSIARYHPEIDAVVIQFVNTVGDNTLTLANVVYGRVVDIIVKQNSN